MCVAKRNTKKFVRYVSSMTSEYCLSNLSCKYRLLDNSLMSRKFKVCVYSVFQGLIYFLLLVLRINIL